MIKNLILAALLTFSSPTYADFASGNAAAERGDFEKALEIWMPLAKNGDAKSQNGLGLIYRFFQKDFDKAILWLKLSSEQGYVEAQYNLGELFFEVDDKPKGIKWFRSAAENGHALSQVVLGSLYLNGTGLEKNNTKAVMWFRAAAEKGHFLGQHWLAQMHFKGMGTNLDKSEAARLFKLAAEQGHVASQDNLAYIYKTGDGLPQNYQSAIYWFTEAAKLGFASAQNHLALMFENGEGVEKDSAEAIRLYTMSAKQGLDVAQTNLGLSYRDGTGVKKNLNEAKKWFRKAAGQGYADGQFFLGLALLDNGEVSKTQGEAFEWLLLAAEQGLADAQAIVGEMYYKGLGVPKDDQAAFTWLKLAAEKDIPIAQTNLGYLFYNGEGVAQDKDLAKVWFMRAAGNGEKSAQSHLGWILKKELQGSSDNSEAKKWFQMAVRNGEPRAYIGLIDFLLEEGKFGDAEYLAYTAIAELSKNSDISIIEEYEINSGLTLIFLYQGQYELAIKFSRNALGLAHKQFGKNSTEYAVQSLNLSSIHLKNHNNLKAKKLIKEALKILENLETPHSEELAYAKYLMGEVQFASGSDPTQNYFEATELARNNNSTSMTFILGKLKGSLAKYQIREGDFFEAEKNIEISRSIFSEGIRKTHPIMFENGFNLASVYLATDRILAAKKLLDELQVNIIQLYRNDQVSKNQSSSGTKEHISAAISKWHLLEDDQNVFNKIFQLHQIATSNILSRSVILNTIKSSSKDANLEGLMQQQKTLEKQLLIISQKLMNTIIANVEDIPKLEKQKTKIQTKLDGILSTLLQQDEKYLEYLAPPLLKVTEFQNLLDNGEGLFTFVSDDETEATYAFFVTKDDARAYEIDLSENDIAAIVGELRAGIDLSNSSGFGDLPNFDMDLSYDLYSKLFGPVEDMLEGVKHLLVVPTGPLESLPLNLLVTEKPDIDPTASVFENYQAAAWLPKTYSLTRLPSVSSLRALRIFTSAGQSQDPFIGFGDPVLDGPAGDLRGLTVEDVYQGGEANIAAVRNLPELPETSEELKRIAAYLGAPEDKIYLRERASETVLKNTDLTNSRVVAFATHGLVGGEISGLAEPALVLSPPSEATDEDDGLLKASEVAQLKMNADMVLLSACNTASGDELGAEGLSGLARAFIYAGARSLLVSHWSVESTSAAELTTGLFDAINQDQELGRSEALQRSMIELMTDEDRPYYSHPAFWAPFSLIGDGQTVELN